MRPYRTIQGPGRMHPKTAATVTDVARLAGVTTITVSRAFNKPQLLKPQTLEHILRIARDLDYVPNAFARGLKRSESRIIGVVAASAHNPFYADMLQGVSRTARRHGYTIMLVDTDGEPALEESAVQTLLGYRVAGLILSPVSDQPGYQPGYLGVLRKGDTPVVQLDRALHDVPFSHITLDNVHSGEAAAGYLLAQQPGIERLLLLTGPAGSRISEARLAGVHAALAHSRLAPQVVALAGDYTLAPAYHATLAYLAEHGAPDAVLGFNQLITLGALKALRHHGCPWGSVRVCGIDPLPFADAFGRAVACVSHDGARAGEAAVQQLLAHIAAPELPPAVEVIPATLLPPG